MFADANTVSAVGAVCAAVASLVAIVVSMRSNGHSRRSADASEAAAESARLSAEAADRTAVAEETVAAIEAAREQRDAKRRASEEQEARDALKRATFILQTERDLDPTRAFGAPDDGYMYFLTIFNSGNHKASNLAINNLACNGSGDHDYPANAPANQLAPREALIPNRGMRIRLQSVGEHNCWDISECTVRWEDGLGLHDARMAVRRMW